ncbi:MAG: 2-hydroxyacid dehydrogenase [Chitinivibrionales bacterium]|nr:2-hydroxyacid dehydrogenase [Chitinivibrionales bacterium]
MELPRIAFFDTKPYDRKYFTEANAKYQFPITWLEPRLNSDTAALARNYPAVCAFVNDVLDEEVLAILGKGTRLIALRSAGYNNVDMKAAFGRIHVVRVPDYSPHAVAEHTVALILALNRKTHRAYYRIREANFSINGLLGFDMFGKTAGVIGTGKIGKRVISILRGFGMHVLAHDPYQDDDAAKAMGFRYVPLDELYARSDVITLHCPLTRENVHLINKDSIAGMKDGVMVVNTGRGGLIDTRALIDGLLSHRVGAAGLDVYEEETDYFFEDHSSDIIPDEVLARLLTFNNVIVTSHQAFFTHEALTNIAETTLHNIHEYFVKDELPNEICYRCCDRACNRKVTGRCFD